MKRIAFFLPLLAASVFSAAPSIRTDSAPLDRNASAPLSYGSVVRAAEASVVQVITHRSEGDISSQFFGRSGGSPTSVGSGVIVTADGRVLTAASVVAGAGRLEVKLADGSLLPVRLDGVDEASGLAVLSIDAKSVPAAGLPVAVFADSGKVITGDRVLVVGWPFGVLTVTQGIVGVPGRPDPDGKGLVEFIQTDAAVNPGAAGGALIDMRGRVVGLAVATQAPGASLAVPSNFARLVAEQLIATGRAERWSLGAAVLDLTPEQRAMGLHGGAAVTEIAPGGVADRAGIRAGDIILEFDGKTVRDTRQLRFFVASTPPGRKVIVALLHDDAETRKAGPSELWRVLRSVTLNDPAPSEVRP